MRKSYSLSVAALGATLLSASSVFATPGKGEDRLREAIAATSGSKSIAVDLEQSYTMVMGEMNETMESTYTVALERPSRIAMKFADGQDGTTIVSDGTTLTYYVPMLQKYTESEAPKKLSDLFDMSKLQDYGIMDNGPLSFLSAVMLPENAATFLGHLGSDFRVEELGEADGMVHLRVHMKADQVDGIDYAQMGLDVSDVDMPIDYWVTSTGDARVSKMSPNLNGIMEAMQKAYGEMMGDEGIPDISITMSFNDWQLNRDMAASAFAFDAPDTAKKVDDMFAADMDMEMPDDPAEALLGNSAPTFQLELLDGGVLDLSSHFGKDVVVLDFWATWCGPCVKALPEYMKVFDGLEGENVAFYAVDLRESDDRVKEFLGKKGWDSLTVAMDRNGSVADLYHVSGIPQTVVIGKDGTVQAVHVGFMPGVDKTLDTEVRKLLAGESLVEKK
ncbi:MAG: redoxin domain-containing protein [Planctomycetota bacterium]